MKHFAVTTTAWIIFLAAIMTAPAFGQLPCLIGDIDGFGMESGPTSLLNSLINMPPYIKSANIDVAVGACDTYTYKPFSKAGATYILQEGDFLPDVDPICSENLDPSFIPLPLTFWPAYIRGVWCEVVGSRASNYANYARGSNPWITTSDVNTDCWDNRESAEITDTYARYTDITLSTGFSGGWPHLMADYPLAADYDPITFNMAFFTTAPTSLYLYFPIGDYDAGAGATVTITAMVGNDTTPHTFSLTKQDNTFQQGLIQGVSAELYNGLPPSAGCGMPIYDDWSDFAVLWGSAYVMGFTIELDMDTDPYYAIDYVVIDDSLFDYNVLMVGPNRTYTTIQSAIDAAIDGDTILVDPGTYYENVNFNGKRLTLTKWMECDNPVIDGGGVNPAITLLGTEGQGTSIRGFDLTHGYGAYGGGVCANGANVQIEQCNFYDNSAGMGGALYNTKGYVVGCTFTSNIALAAGAAFLYGCSPRFENCVFGGTDTADGNAAALGGGAVVCQSASGMITAPSFWRCTFLNNSSLQGGALYSIGNSATYTAGANITNCVFWQNKATGNNGYGGALHIREFSSMTVINSTFTLNTTVRANAGGAAYVNGTAAGPATLTMRNALSWDNTSNGAVSEIAAGAYGTKTVRYSAVEGETNNYSIWLVGSSGWNPNFISTAPATLNLRPQNALVGLLGCDPAITGPKKDIAGVTRPLAPGTKADWGAYEAIGTY